MYFTVYRTVNKLDGKIYIGKHETNNLHDEYLGSGKHLKLAVKKYGRENFTKEILFVFDNKQEMDAKEAELVTEAFCSEDTNYNLCPGGKGGWGYINNCDKFKNQRTIQNKLNSPFNKSEFHDKRAEGGRKGGRKSGKILAQLRRNGDLPWAFSGKKHSDETKQKISKKNSLNQLGDKNSQFGSMWITNGLENKKIKNSDIIPDGWNKGRKIK